MLPSGEELPSKSTVIRLAKAIQVPPGGGPPALAFTLREHRGESEISVGWLEYFSSLPDFPSRMREVLALQSRNYNMKKSGWALHVDVDKARRNLSDVSALMAVRFKYTPSMSDPSHSSIDGIAKLDEPAKQLAAEQIALAVVGRFQWSRLVEDGFV